MTTHLFVYGTLMQNHDNPYAKLIQSNSKLIGKGFIYAKKHNLGDYPGIKLCLNKEHKTEGELYEIKTNLSQILTELDYYEGYNSKNIKKSLFIRKEIPVFKKGNTQVKAWVYEYAMKV